MCVEVNVAAVLSSFVQCMLPLRIGTLASKEPKLEPKPCRNLASEEYPEECECPEGQRCVGANPLRQYRYAALYLTAASVNIAAPGYFT